MFKWFGKRKQDDVGDSLPAFAPAPPHSAPSPLPEDPGLTLPAGLHDAALTVPADLETLQELRATRELPTSNLAWLLGAQPPVSSAAPTTAEAALLRRIDAQLAAPTLAANLLPRAPAVVPQLLGLLRREQAPPRHELARQVAKDGLLTAEVLRAARSAVHGLRPVERLEDALDRIGEDGLQQATARVLFKPVFQAPAGGQIARAAPRIWLYAEIKSGLCAELAPDPALKMDAFLAGLMHDTGWIALLRLVERTGAPLPRAWSTACDEALAKAKDRLFGRLTAGWQLSASLTELALAMSRNERTGLLAPLVHQADRLCLAHLDSVAQDAPAA